jgi:hypothetical protein
MGEYPRLAGQGLLKAILFVLLLSSVMPGAWAFTACSRRSLSIAPASVPEEREDPAVSGRNIYAAYSDSWGLVLRASHDAGATWASTMLDPVGILPRIAASGHRVYIAWLARTASKWSVEFLRSEDDGETFLGKTDLGPFYRAEEPPIGEHEIQIAVSGSLVAVITRPDIDDMAVAVSN